MKDETVKETNETNTNESVSADCEEMTEAQVVDESVNPENETSTLPEDYTEEERDKNEIISSFLDEIRAMLFEDMNRYGDLDDYYGDVEEDDYYLGCDENEVSEHDTEEPPQ